MDTVVQTLVLIGSLGAMMWGMMKFLLKDIHKVLEDIKSQTARHEVRIDYLYQTCVELMKEIKSCGK